LPKRSSKLEQQLLDSRFDMAAMSILVAQVPNYESLLERIVTLASMFLNSEVVYLVETKKSEHGDDKLKLAFHSDRSVNSPTESEIPQGTFIDSSIKSRTAMIIKGSKDKGAFKVKSDPNTLRNSISIPMVGLDGNVLGAIVWQNRIGGDFENPPFDKQRVTEFIRMATNALELAKSVAQICYLADYDQMTGLIRRDRLASFVDGLISDKRFGTWIHFVIIDLDGFKSINDRFGHTTGDELIKVCANYLKVACDVGNVDNVVCSHWGGDEFTFALVSYSKEEGQEFAGRVRIGLTAAVASWASEKDIEDCHLTASVGGCSIARHRSVTYNILVKEADNQLSLAKSSGKDQMKWRLIEGGHSNV
jgi:diguanylate cyclase (GGDEF)-like protein